MQLVDSLGEDLSYSHFRQSHFQCQLPHRGFLASDGIASFHHLALPWSEFRHQLVKSRSPLVVAISHLLVRGVILSQVVLHRAHLHGSPFTLALEQPQDACLDKVVGIRSKLASLHLFIFKGSIAQGRPSLAFQFSHRHTAPGITPCHSSGKLPVLFHQPLLILVEHVAHSLIFFLHICVI